MELLIAGGRLMESPCGNNAYLAVESAASPLLVNDKIYIATQSGTVYVIAASPERFDLVATNPSGQSIFATPVAIEDRLYFRTGIGYGGDRKEYLVAAGRNAPQNPSNEK